MLYTPSANADAGLKVAPPRLVRGRTVESSVNSRKSNVSRGAEVKLGRVCVTGDMVGV